VPAHAFPWREEESLRSGEVILRPTLDVEVSLGALGATTKALVDTGAPRSVFPRGVGDLLGLSFPSLRSSAPHKITLMGDDWPAITATATLRLQPFADVTWEADIDFVMDEGLPFALLGYEGFLNRWAVSFNGYLGYFLVEPAEEFDERQDDALFQST
jgi:hypothetical protein